MTQAAHSGSRKSKAVFALLLAMLVLSTIAYGAVDAWAMSILAVFAAIVMLLWIAEAFAAKGFTFSTSSLQIPVAALIAIGCVQLLPIDVFRSIDPYATRFFVIRLMIYLVFFAAMLAFVNSGSRYRTLVIAIIIFGAVMAFFGILQKLAGPDAIYGLRPTPQAIPFGPFVNQHHFAAFMEMTGGLALGLLFGGGTKKDKRLLLAMAVVVMGIAVIFTSSRGGMLSFLAVFTFVIFATFRTGSTAEAIGERTSQKRVGIAVGALALLAAAAGIVIFLGGGESLVRGVGLQASEADVSSGRFHFWNVAIKIIFEDPILGTGFDSFGMAFSKFDTRSGLYRVEQAHNDYLQILSDAGIIGFICVSAFIYLLFRKGLTSAAAATDRFQRAATIGAMAGCFGIIIHSFFDFPLRTASNGFFFLALAAIATMPNIIFERGGRKHAGVDQRT